MNTRSASIWIIMIAIATAIGVAFAGTAPTAPVAPAPPAARVAPVAPTTVAPAATVAPVAPIGTTPVVAPTAPVTIAPIAPIAPVSPPASQSANVSARAPSDFTYTSNGYIITNSYLTNGLPVIGTNVGSRKSNLTPVGFTNTPIRIILPVGQPLISTSAPPAR